MRIIRGDLDHPDIINLLKFHLDTNIAVTPVGSVHALDLDALKVPEVAFFAGWQEKTPDTELLVIGALKAIEPGHGEIKSMRTVEAHRAKGLGAQMLDHIIAHASQSGMNRLSLETGSFDYFEPARKLYEKRGFTYCEPFAGYTPDPNSAFMTKVL
ncbi:MAG: GNAT family N-acetyltransferase [Devosiaceae bacterium]